MTGPDPFGSRPNDQPSAGSAAEPGLAGGPHRSDPGRDPVASRPRGQAEPTHAARPGRDEWSIEVFPTDEPGHRVAYARLRRLVFGREQGLFPDGDRDHADGDPRTRVVVARRRDDGAVVGGVRIHPMVDGPDLGWWRGSRLAVDTVERAASAHVGARLVQAACALAAAEGALRFDATVQVERRPFFERLGWVALDRVVVAGRPHVLMVWPVTRIADLVAATKQPLGRLLAALAPGGAGWIGDDAAPVPGAGPGLVAACDAVTPSMVEEDPEWAGWCGVLVNVNDLAAMGAAPVGLLDAIGARDEAHARRILSGLRAASEAWGVPVLGGHTQLGVHGSLAVTALGHADDPVPGGGGRAGDDVRLIVDLAGGWRPGYTGRQWDSTTSRSPAELRHLTATLARRPPAAAKDVSMAGVVGTLAMLAEASGCGAELVVADVPAPEGAGRADWLTCFPGFGLLTADRPGAPEPDAGPATTARCGQLTADPGVRLVWPDGRATTAVAGAASGLGAAGPPDRTQPRFGAGSAK